VGAAPLAQARELGAGIMSVMNPGFRRQLEQLGQLSPLIRESVKMWDAQDGKMEFDRWAEAIILALVQENAVLAHGVAVMTDVLKLPLDDQGNRRLS
jgi:hypothetical protein